MARINKKNTGEADLDKLIGTLEPRLEDGAYVFCTIRDTKSRLEDLQAICTFQEKEGTTLILQNEIADKHKIPYNGIWSLITCTVHSDLEAIGLIAVIADKLAQARISVNVVSAYFHDHLFVPQKDGTRALEILNELSSTPTAGRS